MNFPTGKRLAAMKKLNDKAHWEPCKSMGASIKYCMKEETRMEGPWEFGEAPVQRDSKEDWAIVKNLA